MKTVLKWAGLIMGGLALILVLGGVILNSAGARKANTTYEVTTSLLSSAPSDSASIAQGAHLAKIHGCAECN